MSFPDPRLIKSEIHDALLAYFDALSVNQPHKLSKEVEEQLAFVYKYAPQYFEDISKTMDQNNMFTRMGHVYGYCCTRKCVGKQVLAFRHAMPYSYNRCKNCLVEDYVNAISKFTANVFVCFGNNTPSLINGVNKNNITVTWNSDTITIRNGRSVFTTKSAVFTDRDLVKGEVFYRKNITLTDSGDLKAFMNMLGDKVHNPFNAYIFTIENVYECTNYFTTGTTCGSGFNIGYTLTPPGWKHFSVRHTNKHTKKTKHIHGVFIENPDSVEGFMKINSDCSRCYFEQPENLLYKGTRIFSTQEPVVAQLLDEIETLKKEIHAMKLQHAMEIEYIHSKDNL